MLSIVLVRWKPEPQGMVASSVPLEMGALLSDHTAEQAVAAYGRSTQADSHGTVDVWGPILQTVREESFCPVFPGLGAQLWMAGWHIPYRMTGQVLPTRTEDKVRERNP